MRTAKDWLKHYSPINKNLEELFLSLTPDDCREILIENDQVVSEGVSYESTENRVFGFEKIVIKFYRPGRWTLEAIAEEIAFLEELSVANISFVRSLGKVGTWKGIHYIVFEKIEEPFLSNRRVIDEASVRKMVHLVAKLHQVGAKKNAPARAQFNPRAMTAGCFEVIKNNGYLPQSLYSRYQKLINELIKKFDELGEIPVQRIHGDTYSGNFLWKDNNPILMDLDDFQVGPIALDVRLLSFPWRLESLPESMEPRERRKRQHDMVLKMYREVNPFPEIQEKVLPYLGAYRDIQFDAWFSARWGEPGFTDAYADDDITEPGYWIDSIEGLEESIFNN